MELIRDEATSPTGTPDRIVAQRPPVRAVLLVGFLIGLAMRFHGLSLPPYDAHSFRQTQTLSTIDFFHQSGIDLLHPRTGYAGFPGTFVLELPLFQALAATLYAVLGPHLETVRSLNILFGLATTWLLFRTVALMINRRTALWSAFIYWLAPLNIGYQRSTLLDPMAVFFGLAAFYSLSLLLFARSDAVSSPQGYWICLAFFAITTWFAAMTKALYLWPVVMLLSYAAALGRLKPEPGAARIIGCLAIAGFSFLAWNFYAARINNASPFTRGIQPTSLLGISALFDMHFYYYMLVRRPRWWLGVISLFLYAAGLYAGWAQRHERARTAVFLLMALVPPTYLLVFSRINRPHEYYQLIITPFLAVTAGCGLNWLEEKLQSSLAQNSLRALALPTILALMAASAPPTYLFWYHGGRPDPRVLRFERLCSGRVVPGSSAMIFVATAYADAPPGAHLPEFLYAAKAWGYARVIDRDQEAQGYFNEFAEAFPALDYVIEFGSELPKWVPSTFRLAVNDEADQLYVFKRVRDSTAKRK